VNTNPSHPDVGDWVSIQLNVTTVNQWTATNPSSYYGFAIAAPSESNDLEWKIFDSTSYASRAPYVFFTYTPNGAPQVNTTSPVSGYNSSTLTPTLHATASDLDNWPGLGLAYDFAIFDGANDKRITGSGAGCGGGSLTYTSPSWTVPAGSLKWGQSYYWAVEVCDGYAWSPWSASSSLVTAVPPPLLTSSLSQNSSGHGFDPALGNYTTAATDLQVATAGPALAVTRDYNSLDPRTGQALGAGWSSLLDAQAAEQYDSGGTNVLSVTVTYPDGSQVGFGKNADGSFSPPLGRYATLAAVSGGYTLTDKNGTVYTFTHLAAAGSGVYQISAITDAATRELEVKYSAATGGQTTELVSDVSKRAIYFSWITPPNATYSHVHTAYSDPVTSGGVTAALTWTYNYTGDRLASVCSPTSATACTGYQYQAGSQYRTAQLDGAPTAYWPLSESSYGSSGVAADQVLANEHSKDATYSGSSSVGFGAGGPLAGSTATAVSLDGTSGSVALPQNLITGTTYVSVSLWFRTATTSSSGPLFCEQSSALSATPGNATCSLYVGTDGKLHGQWFVGSFSQMVSTVAVNDTHWHHVVLSGANGTQQLYLDGSTANIAGGPLSGQINNLSQTYEYVGAGYNSAAWPATPGTAGNWFFHGYVSDVAVYNAALAASTVAGLHTAGTTSTSLLKTITRPSTGVSAQIAYSTLSGRVTQVIDADGHAWQVGAPSVSGSAEGYRAAVLGSAPTDYWRLGDAAGASSAYNEVAADGSNATYSSGVTLGAAGPLSSAQSAATFNGSSTDVAVPASWINGSTSITASLWFKTGSTTQMLFSLNGAPLSGAATGYFPTLYVGADGKLVGEWWTGDAYTPIESPGSVTDGNWHQAVLAGSGASQTLYLDGKAVGSKSGTISLSGANYDYIGAGFIGGTWPDESGSGSTGTAHYFNGSIAEVALYHSALTGSDVAAQYAAAKNASSLNPTVTVKVTDPSTASAPIAFDGTTYAASAAKSWTGRSTRLVFQTDGNLVIQRVDTGATLWASGTAGHTSATLALQADGNLVIYNGSTALWASSTNYNPGNTAVLQGDGDLVIGDTAGRQLWESGTTIPGMAGVLIYEYDPVNGERRIAQYDAAGAKTTYGYDTSGFVHAVVDGNGDETITGHDARGNTVSQSSCQSQSTNACSTSYYSYWPLGKSTAVISPDPRNDMLLTASDGRSSSATDLAYRTSYDYDQYGNRTTVTTPPVPGYTAGRTATTVYTTPYTSGTVTYPASDDGTKAVPAGLPWTQTSAGGAVTQYHYYVDGDVYSVTSPSGGLTTGFTYDQLGRPLAKSVTYNTAANCTSSCATSALTTTNVYDGQNRATTVTAPASMDRVTGNTHQARTSTVYDLDGNVTSQTIDDVGGSPAPDASRTSLTHYNTLGQLDWSMDAQQYIDGGGSGSSPNLADATQFQYDAYGRKAKTISAQDQNGRSTVTDYGYDGDGRLTYTTLEGYTGSPSGSQSAANLVQEARAYDPGGRLAAVTDAMGFSTLYQYYDNNLTATVTRCKTATINGGVATCTDSSFAQESDSYDNAGNLIKSVTNNGTTETDYTFDAAGRKTQSTLDPNGLNRTTTKTYNKDDLVVSQRTGDAHGSGTTDYQYNADGAMTSQSVENYTTGAPTGWWKLNDGAAGATTPTIARDSSGNGNTGTLNSGVSWASGAAAFNSSSSGAIATSGTGVNTAASYTVSAWVNLAATPTTYTTVVGAPGAHDSAFYLQYSVSAGGWAFVTTSADSTSEVQATSHATGTPAANTWYHLVGVYDASLGTVQLYVNAAAATAVTQTSAWNATQGLSIGSAGGSNYVNGQVANVQVYPRALTQGDVTTLYGNGRSGAGVSAASNTTSWSLDGRDLPLSMTDADSKTTSYVYDEAGRRAITEAPVVTAGTYSPSGGYTTISPPGPPTTTTGYDTFGETAEVKDPTGIETSTSYDADGRPTKTTLVPDYQQPGTTYNSLLTGKYSKTQYNELGESTATWDPAGVQTSYAYDQLGHRTSVTLDPTGLNRTTTTAYDADGDTLQSADPTGAIQSAIYDYLGRTQSSTQVLGLGGSGSTQIPTGCSTYNNVATQAACTTQYFYTDTAGFLSKATSQRGVSTAYGYDAAGERTGVTDAANQTTSTAYDYAGRAVKTTMPDNTYTTVSYNQAGQQTGAAQYDASNTQLRSTSAAYDGNGNTLSSTDANGNTTSYSYDDAGRLSSETQPASYTSTLAQVPSVTQTITTSFGYDAAGRQTKYVTGNGNTWYTTYNAWGLQETSVEPATSTYTTAANSTFTVTYDADGRPVEQDSPGGVAQTQSYDNAGETLSQTGSGAPTATRSFTYYANGLLHTAATGNTSNATSDTFTYDDSGALAATSGSSGTSAFTYNADGQMASRADTVGTSTYTTGYSYDSTTGRPSTIADALTGTTLTYGYTPNSPDYAVTYGAGGDVRSYHYNTAHELASDTLTSASTTVASIAYGYDPNGNETTKTTTGFTGAATNTYTYDQANRLKSWNNGTTVTGYSYDQDSNRTNAAGTTFTYDARDQITSDGTNTYAYTARGTLQSTTSATGTATTTTDAYGQTQTDATDAYTYDALGRVVQNGATAFDYSGTGNTLSYDGNTTYSRDPAGNLVADQQAGASRLLWTDQHTDVVASFTATGTALTGSTSYDPLGQILSKTGNQTALGYQSEYTSPATGKVDMAARWYNPKTGQFTSKDTATNSPVPNTAAANPFAYGNDNPLTATDPSGHRAFYDDGNNRYAEDTAAVHSDFRQQYQEYRNPTYLTQMRQAFTLSRVSKPNVVSDAKPVCKAISRQRSTCDPPPNLGPSGNVLGNVGSFIAGVGRIVPETIDFALNLGGAPECLFRSSSDCVDLSHGYDVLVTHAGVDTNNPAYLGGDTLVNIVALAYGLVKAIKEAPSLIKFVKQLIAGDDKGVDLSTPTGGCDSQCKASKGIRGTNKGNDPGTLTKTKSSEGTGSTNVDTQPATPVTRGVSASKVEPTAPEQAAGAPDASSCLTPHSFTGNTPVLMAGGTVKPIDQIHAGEQITNAAPNGTTETHTVDKVIVTTTDHDFAALSITPVHAPSGDVRAATAATEGNGLGSGARAKISSAAVAAAMLLAPATAQPTHANAAQATTTAPAAVLTTTYHHQFYDVTTNQWTQAENLKTGDLLQTPTGYALVEGVQIYHANTTTYDLTIDGLHTYYVEAGSTPVLVHNYNVTGVGCGDEPDLGSSVPTREPASVGNAGGNTNYRQTFYDANPGTQGNVWVHHAIEQQVLNRYPGLFSADEIHSVENLRGIPKGAINSRVHLSAIRNMWNDFYSANPSPARQDVLDYATGIDDQLGQWFTPRIR
jgi:large repetitive protein